MFYNTENSEGVFLQGISIFKNIAGNYRRLIPTTPVIKGSTSTLGIRHPNSPALTLQYPE